MPPTRDLGDLFEHGPTAASLGIVRILNPNRIDLRVGLFHRLANVHQRVAAARVFAVCDQHHGLFRIMTMPHFF